MFRFANSEYLYALYLIPVIIVLLWLIFRNQKKITEQFVSSKILEILAPERSLFKQIVKSSLIVLSLILLILALANPQIGTRTEQVKQTGIDVFILLDVSLSMKAEDIKPNRLDKAKYSISSLIQRLRGDRIGLVIFSGRAYIQFPLTTDYAAANLLLNSVDVNSVPQPGTAIASAIELAANSFKQDVTTQKAIVIITDGEDHQGNIEKAIDKAKEKGIKIYTIGYGSPDGAPIPVYNQYGRRSGYKLDNDGNIVLTKLNEDVLKKISSNTEAKYFRGSNSEDELKLIYNSLANLDQTEFGTAKVTTFEDRFYYLLAPAILLLILEFFLSERKSIFWEKVSKKLGLKSE